MKPSFLRRPLEIICLCQKEAIIFKTDFGNSWDHVDWVFFLGQFCGKEVFGFKLCIGFGQLFLVDTLLYLG